jgi:osmotically-inducible protein OsmY
MARDWEGREGNRGYGERGDDWRRERDWSDKASDEARSWFGDEDAERRRMMDNQYRGERDYRRDTGRSDSREDR